MNMPKLIESIFNYKNENGTDCLIISFDMMAKYYNETGNFPDSSLLMFNEIESTILCLIKRAEDNKLNMDEILNLVTENGKTLFHHATIFSESLALELLTSNVDVKTIDDLFQTPSFEVS